MARTRSATLAATAALDTADAPMARDTQGPTSATELLVDAPLPPASRAEAPAAPDSPETERRADPATAGPLTPAAKLRRPQPDWLHHNLTVTGPAEALAAWRAAASGAGIVPWTLDLDRIEEDLFHRLVAPPPPQTRSLSLAGARILARELRDAVASRHELAVARVGHSRACPFDLHALIPVPDTILRLGPDHLADAWLWENWGTWEVRRITEFSSPELWRIKFWSADWTPWRALATLRQRWPQLRFDIRPTYAR